MYFYRHFKIGSFDFLSDRQWRADAELYSGFRSTQERDLLFSADPLLERLS